MPKLLVGSVHLVYELLGRDSPEYFVGVGEKHGREGSCVESVFFMKLWILECLVKLLC